MNLKMQKSIKRPQFEWAGHCCCLRCTADGLAHHNDPEGECQERAGVSSDKRLCKERNEMDGGLQ